MNLYYIKTIFQLLCAILDKIEDKKCEKAVLFCNGYVKNRINVEVLNKLGFNFILYNTDKITNRDNSSSAVFLNDIEKYYDDLLSANGYVITDFKKVDIYASIRFSLYMSLKKQKFRIHEDGNGSASKYGFVQWRKDTDKVNKSELAEKYGLLDASSHLIEAAYCRLESQTKKFGSNAVDYNINNELAKLDAENLKQIYSVFSDESINFGIEPSLVLSQYYFKNQNYIDEIEKRAHLYQTICNYFVPSGNIIFKAHPNDNVEYQKYFDVQFVNKNLPSELLNALASNVTYENILTISSTSVEALKKQAKNVLIFDNHENWADLPTMIEEYFDILQGAIIIFWSKFKSHIFNHYGIFNNPLNKLLNINGFTSSRWYNSEQQKSKRFIVVCKETWGSNYSDRFSMRLNPDDIYVLCDYDKHIIKDYDYYTEMTVTAGKFSSKALIVCGSLEALNSIENFEYTKKLMTCDMHVYVSSYIECKLNKLEKILNNIQNNNSF